jgi:DNA-binding NtrC family response regulator
MPQRILVVDDELDMLMLLRMMIEDSTDYEVETTNNPSEALKILTEKDIDLVISDLKMPGMDGMELFDEVKDIKPDIPVIIITAYGSLEMLTLSPNLLGRIIYSLPSTGSWNLPG